MSIVPVRTNNDFLRQYPYSPYATEESSAVDDGHQEYAVFFNRVTGNTLNGDKVLLSRNRADRTNRDSAASGQASSGRERHSVGPDGPMSSMSASRMGRTGFLFRIDSESLSDQYNIGKFAMGMTNPVINRYREAQTYRYWVTTTIEVYA